MEIKKLFNCVYIVGMFVMIGSCTSSHQTDDSVPVMIDIDIDKVELNTFSEDQLIPLESTDSSVLYDICELFPIEDKWVVRSRSYIRAFDMATGKYLYDISNKGQGPEEYLSIYQATATKDTLRVLDINSRCIKDFLADGNYVGKGVDFKDNDADGFINVAYAVESPDGKKYFAINCYNGGVPEPVSQYMVISKDGKFLQHVPGRKLYDGSFTPDRMYTDFEHGRVLAWEQLRDTLFSVTEEGVEPIYVFDFGKNKFPIKSQQHPEFYLRVQDFGVRDAEYPYASFIKYYQVKGDNLYFSFFTNEDEENVKVYLAVVNEKTHDVRILHYETADGRYRQQPFFKIFDDKIVISVNDTENAEENPMLLVLPIDSL